MFRPAFAIFAQQYLSVLLGDFGTVYLNEPIPRNPNLRVYKHPSRSNWGTEFLSAVTAGNNRVMVSPEVIGEASLVDVLFEPDTEKSRTSLGLLGELASYPCIVEILRWAPDEWELQTCLHHWLTWRAEGSGSIIPIDEYLDPEEEEDEYEEEDEEESDTSQESLRDRFNIDKTLLIIVPSIAPQQIEGFAAQPFIFNIPGIYELPPAFCTTIVVTSELPQDISTLWLRLLGRGRTQRDAILELLALDINYPHRAATVQQLQQWYRLLSQGQMGKESKQLMETLAIVDGLN
jgi:hypothetical protein